MKNGKLTGKVAVGNCLEEDLNPVDESYGFSTMWPHVGPASRQSGASELR